MFMSLNLMSLFFFIFLLGNEFSQAFDFGFNCDLNYS